MHKRLVRYFTNITTPVLGFDPRKCANLNDGKHLVIRANKEDVVDEIKKANRSWVFLKGYGNNIALYKRYLSRLKTEFRLPGVYGEISADFFANITAEINRDPIFACIHVRRQDYPAFLRSIYEAKPVLQEFYHRAFDALRRILPKEQRKVSIFKTLAVLPAYRTL